MSDGKRVEFILAGTEQRIALSASEEDAAEVTDVFRAAWDTGKNTSFAINARNGLTVVNAFHVAAIRISENTNPAEFGPRPEVFGLGVSK